MVLFMKSKVLKLLIIAIMFVNVVGCVKVDRQKDTSFETDIVGAYEIKGQTDEDNEITYYKKYMLEDDNSYAYESSVFGTESKSNGIYTANNLTSNIIEIDFDIKNVSFDNEDSVDVNSARQYKKVFKYKNMIGSIVAANNIPNTETFDYVISDEFGGGMSFSKDGQYHNCINLKDCKCDYASCAGAKYVRKDNIIYFNTGESNNYWSISNYIVDDYLFTPELYKIK